MVSLMILNFFFKKMRFAVMNISILDCDSSLYETPLIKLLYLKNRVPTICKVHKILKR